MYTKNANLKRNFYLHKAEKTIGHYLYKTYFNDYIVLDT